MLMRLLHQAPGPQTQPCTLVPRECVISVDPSSSLTGCIILGDLVAPGLRGSLGTTAHSLHAPLYRGLPGEARACSGCMVGGVAAGLGLPPCVLILRLCPRRSSLPFGGSPHVWCGRVTCSCAQLKHPARPHAGLRAR